MGKFSHRQPVPVSKKKKQSSVKFHKFFFLGDSQIVSTNYLLHHVDLQVNLYQCSCCSFKQNTQCEFILWLTRLSFSLDIILATILEVKQ